MKITTPTPIQHQSIPVGMEGKDILGIAQTGTGKTLAFGIPVVHRMDRYPGRALILLPTRELALQVHETLSALGRAFDLHSAVLIGGVPIHGQLRDLARRPRLIIATPGRLIDILDQGRIDLHDVRFLVLDEADRMFDMGFAPQLQRIFKMVPKERQTLLFSATMSPAVLKLATAVMALPVRVEVAPAGTSAATVEQEIFITPRETRLSLLEKLLQELRGPVLVFSRTKFGAKKVAHTLKLMGHKTAELHSNRSQAQRREALSGFKSGRYQVLVATDIAARGIDVVGIEAVINFDLPANSEDYVHRIGRTGRAGRAGRAISFALPEQRGEIRAIERLIRKTLKISQTPDVPPLKPRTRTPDYRLAELPQGAASTPQRNEAPAAPHRKRRRRRRSRYGRQGPSRP